MTTESENVELTCYICGDNFSVSKIISNKK